MGGNSNFARPMPPTYRGCTVYNFSTSTFWENLDFKNSHCNTVFVENIIKTVLNKFRFSSQELVPNLDQE